MRKKDEVNNPHSCLNNAYDHEMIFVLLARDPAAPSTIRHWCHKRVLLGKNSLHDKQIQEALQCALAMEDGK